MMDNGFCVRKNQGNNNNNLHFDSVWVLSIFDSYETTAVTAVATAAAAAKEKEVQYFLTCARWLNVQAWICLF